MDARSEMAALLRSEPTDFPLLGSELDTAAAIQQTLLQTPLPTIAGADLAAFSRCACRIGGDFYEVHPVGSDQVWLTIADVMGKGVPAALFATSLSPLLRSLSQYSQTPGELLTNLNRSLGHELAKVEMYITAQVVLADLRRRELQVATAGHCPLLIAQPDQPTLALPAEALPLGLEADLALQGLTLPFEPGAAVLLYTDGLTEAQNPDGERFGQERLAATLQRCVQLQLTATEIKQLLLAELRAFEGDAPPADDQTFVILTEESCH